MSVPFLATAEGTRAATFGSFFAVAPPELGTAPPLELLSSLLLPHAASASDIATTSSKAAHRLPFFMLSSKSLPPPLARGYALRMTRRATHPGPRAARSDIAAPGRRRSAGRGAGAGRLRRRVRRRRSRD